MTDILHVIYKSSEFKFFEINIPYTGSLTSSTPIPPSPDHEIFLGTII